MPCREPQNHSAFPSFPSNFELDTPHLYQAIAEHNYKRVEEGLPTQNYFQLSVDGRSAVIARANDLKFASRVRVIPLKLPPSEVPKEVSKERAAILLQRERMHFDAVVGLAIFAAGALILTLVLLNYL